MLYALSDNNSTSSLILLYADDKIVQSIDSDYDDLHTRLATLLSVRGTIGSLTINYDSLSVDPASPVDMHACTIEEHYYNPDRKDITRYVLYLTSDTVISNPTQYVKDIVDIGSSFRPDKYDVFGIPTTYEYTNYPTIDLTQLPEVLRTTLDHTSRMLAFNQLTRISDSDYYCTKYEDPDNSVFVRLLKRDNHLDTDTIDVNQYDDVWYSNNVPLTTEDVLYLEEQIMVKKCTIEFHQLQSSR